MIEEHIVWLVTHLWLLRCVCLFACGIMVTTLISLLSALGAIVLLGYGLARVCAWVGRRYRILQLPCFWIPFLLGVAVLVCGVCYTPDKEEGRFIPRREKPACPCCRAALVHWCIHELGEWRHVFQYECMPVLERLADKLRAAAPPPPQP